MPGRREQDAPQSGPSVADIICTLGVVAEVAGELAEDHMLEAGAAGAAAGAMSGGPGGAVGGAALGLSIAGAASEVGTVGQFAQDLATASSPGDVAIAFVRAGAGSVGRPSRGAVNAVSRVGHYLDVDELGNLNTLFDAAVEGAFSAVTGQAFDPEVQC